MTVNCPACDSKIEVSLTPDDIEMGFVGVTCPVPDCGEVFDVVTTQTDPAIEAFKSDRGIEISMRRTEERTNTPKQDGQTVRGPRVRM